MHHHPRIRPLATAALLAMIMSGAAFGQQRQDQRTDLYKGPGEELQVQGQAYQPVRVDDLNRIDPGIGDVSPLRQSLRDLPIGLRIPSGFSEVYAVPGRPGWFMRANGGLYAVFPQSLYEKKGPKVPHGTIFYIGVPVFQDNQLVGPDPARDEYFGTQTDSPPPTTASEDSDAQTVFHPSIRQRVLATTGGKRRNRQIERDATIGPSIILDRNYRRIRLHELMRRAANAQ